MNKYLHILVSLLEGVLSVTNVGVFSLYVTEQFSGFVTKFFIYISFLIFPKLSVDWKMRVKTGIQMSEFLEARPCGTHL